MLSSVRIQRFKSLEDVTIDLGNLTILVGSNNAGKSSILQALQFAISVAQSLELDGVSRWSKGERSGTLASSQLIYTPLRDVHALARGGPLRQGESTAIAITLTSVTGESATIAVSRGKNKNIAVRVSGEVLGKQIQAISTPFSVVAPGLAGIPSVEDCKTRGIVTRAAARGDANSVFRNVLWILRQDAPKWELFMKSLRKVFPDIDLRVNFEADTDEYIDARFRRAGDWHPIDSAGTGVLQAVQALSYVAAYEPRVLILDEPDAHLHPDNQRKLLSVLGEISESDGPQVLLATHSRHLFDAGVAVSAKLHWLADGEIRETDPDRVRVLLDLGALDAGDRLRNGKTSMVVITEDERGNGLKTLLVSSGLSADTFEVWSYAGSSKIDAALVLAGFIRENAPGTRVIVHRDRDYMSDEEVFEFEQRLRQQGVIPFVTIGVDLESHFLNVEYLCEVWSGLDATSIASLLNEATDSVRDKSTEILANKLIEDANRRHRSDSSAPSPGKASMDAPKLFESDPIRWRHGKRTLKALRALVAPMGLSLPLGPAPSKHLSVAGLLDELARTQPVPGATAAPTSPQQHS